MPCGYGEIWSTARTPAGATNAVRLALRRPTHGCPNACAFHRPLAARAGRSVKRRLKSAGWNRVDVRVQLTLDGSCGPGAWVCCAPRRYQGSFWNRCSHRGKRELTESRTLGHYTPVAHRNARVPLCRSICRSPLISARGSIFSVVSDGANRRRPSWEIQASFQALLAVGRREACHSNRAGDFAGHGPAPPCLCEC